MTDRLTLNDERIEAMASGIEVIAGLADPVGVEFLPNVAEKLA